MSRIAGLVDVDHDKMILEDMFQTMHSQFHDDRKYYENKNCLMLCCGREMTLVEQLNCIKQGDENYWITFDGELYNADELCDELKLSGNESHAQIVLWAYVQQGEAVVDRLLGAFAFAIWHEKERKLFLARDQMGVKPLFYAQHKTGLIFASEIKTILSYPTMEAQLDGEGIAQIMLLGPGRIPGSGVFKGVHELEPGCWAVYENQKIKINRYWSLKDREHTESFEQTAEHIRWLVKDSILRQLSLQGGLGTFLSGGLDSSVISAVCSNLFNQQEKTLDTFSVDYADNDKNFVSGRFQPERDNDYIEIMREFLRSNHHWTILGPQDLIMCLEEATVARDLPGMGDVDFSLLAFCKQIVQQVPVALSGECADEIFGGYPWFSDLEFMPSEGFPWSQNIDYRKTFINKACFVPGKEFVMDHYHTSIAHCDILPGNPTQESRIKQMTYLNQNWFMQTLIDRNDRMSMCSGLKIRAPFCDHRIASYMYAVPWSYKHYADREKGLLRYAMQGIVPDEILWRKKSPYPKTYDPVYTKKVREMLGGVLADDNAPIWNIVDSDAVCRLIEEDLQTPWYGQLMKGPQTMAYMLQVHVWMNKYNVSIV